MAPEALDQIPRQPAIAPEKLLLPNGQFANKYSLQKLAFDAGFPVPEIISEDQLKANDLRRAEDYRKDPELFVKNYWRYVIHCRGYFYGPVDNWNVDPLPTFYDYQLSDKQTFLKLMQDALINPSNIFNLKTNFDVQTIPEARSFLQRSVPEGYYFSTLTRGNNLFCTFIDQARRGKENWIHYTNGSAYDYSSGVREELLEYLEEDLLPLSQRANDVFNNALKCTFEYKHDFLQTREGTFLIQSRIASIKVDERTINEEDERIAKMKESGVAEIRVEIGDVDGLTKSIPKDKPFILSVINNLHKGRANTAMIDFRNMKGLCLPSGLRGGLLEHNGYTIIAYALYWGIPIAFI